MFYGTAVVEAAGCCGKRQDTREHVNSRQGNRSLDQANDIMSRLN